MAVAPPKTVLVPVSLTKGNPILRIFGGNQSEEAVTAATQNEVVLGKKSQETLKLALEKLVLPNDTLVVLMVQPPPANEGPTRLQLFEQEMQTNLKKILRTTIDVASAQNIKVEVAVRLRTDKGQAVFNYAMAVGANIVVLCKSRFSLLGSGSGPTTPGTPGTADFSDINPEALAKALPSTCKVMVVYHGKVVESHTGEQVPGSSAMSIGPSREGTNQPPQPSTPPAVPRHPPSSLAIPEEVLREVYGEVEFDVQEVLQATNSFSDTNQIGIGGSGSVYAGMLRGTPVAIKRLRWWCSGAFGGGGGGASPADSNFRQFLTELRVMRRTRHPNLLALNGVCVCDTELLLVFDFQQNGSLDRRLKKEPLLTWQQRLEIAAGAAAGLGYLHNSCKPPIIHRDVKTANILLDSQAKAKVADFGLAKFAPDADSSQPFTVTSIMGTQGYLAPEYGHSRAITKSIDVFAFGVVLLELVTGHVPFHPDRRPPYLSEYAFKVTMEGDYLRLLDPRLRKTNSPYDMRQLEQVLMLAVLCLSPDPSERPRMDEVSHLLLQIINSTQNGQG